MTGAVTGLRGPVRHRARHRWRVRALPPSGGLVSVIRARCRRHRVVSSSHTCSSMMLCMSVARGEDGPDSDIDLLVDLDVRTRGLLPLAALQDELQELLGERFDVVPQDALAPHVAANALAEAVPL